MNFLGISLPKLSSKELPFAPEGAPLRPGFTTLLAVCCALFGLSLLFAFVFNLHPVIGSIGWVGLVVAPVIPFLYRRRYDRIGWYDRHEVVLPELPFEVRGSGYRIVFGAENITFSAFLSRDKTISYAEIVTVSLDCQGHCLSGVTVRRNVKPYHSATEPPPPQASFNIYEMGDGKSSRTCTAMAILRAKAPHAAFSGPRWVEDGWVPRLGFTHPSPEGGGGGP